MSLLTEALQKIDYWFEHSQSSYASWHRNRQDIWLRPGLERELLELYSEEYNFRFSEEVYELYQWHDGRICIGDMANPVCFDPLDRVVDFIVREHIPCRAYMPLFIGDNAFFVVPEASVSNSASSPIFFFDGWIFPENSDPPWGCFRPEHYAPSITCLMQAIAECAEKFDGISAEYMEGDRQTIYPYFSQVRYRRSILSPIFDKYGVIGDCSGMWR